MAYFIALALLALVSVVASVWLVRTDGYRPIATDPEREARRRDAAPSTRRDRRPSRAGEVPARAPDTHRSARASEQATTALAEGSAEVPALAAAPIPAPAPSPAPEPVDTGDRRAAEAAATEADTDTDADDRVLVAHAAD